MNKEVQYLKESKEGYRGRYGGKKKRCHQIILKRKEKNRKCKESMPTGREGTTFWKKPLKKEDMELTHELLLFILYP